MPAANGRSVRISGPSTPRFGSPLKCEPFALVSEAASGDVSHQSPGFDDLKRFNGIKKGEDFIVDEMARRDYLCTDNKMKIKVIMASSALVCV